MKEFHMRRHTTRRIQERTDLFRRADEQLMIRKESTLQKQQNDKN
jgi:hypothetical protein